MAEFEKCIPHILRHEAGYVNDPKDPGGETKFGISKRAYPGIDIKNLTLEDAKKIYLHDYWAKMKLNYIVSDRVALIVFDHGVNTGTGRAIKMLQFVAEVVIDGAMGSQTINAVNAVPEEVAVNTYASVRKEYYNRITLQNPVLIKFLDGWMARVEYCTTCNLL